MPTLDSLGDVHTKVTAEAVAEMKARVGMVMKNTSPYETTSVAHMDTMRRYAIGIGDDNPLWCDPEYGRSTRWKETIGFPTYEAGGLTEQIPAGREQLPRGDPMRGLHNFMAGRETTFYRPIYGGDRTSTLTIIEAVEERESKFSDKTVHVTRLARMRNQRGDVVRTIRIPFIHTERGSAQEKKKYNYEQPRYTEAEIAEIDASYAAETRRGAESLFWEDVNVGDAVPPVVKAMYTVKDWIGWCVGSGLFGAFGVAPWRIDYLNRTRIPKFYLPGADGIPRSAFDCHYDYEVARAAGVPAPYDIAPMREAFICHMLSNWIGDNGFIHQTKLQMRRFNMLGDTQWCRGEIADKRREGDLNIVDLHVRCENQRGEKTTIGTAIVLLPSRELGPVRLPYAPRDLP